MLNTVNSELPTFAFFLRNVTSRVHYLGFSSNKRGLDTLPNPGNRRETQLSHPNSRWCPGQNSCCGPRERVRDPPWSRDWPWDPALHSPSLGFLTQILVIIICHKTPSHFRGLKGKTERRVQPPQTSAPGGMPSHLTLLCLFLCLAVRRCVLQVSSFQNARQRAKTADARNSWLLRQLSTKYLARHTIHGGTI